MPVIREDPADYSLPVTRPGSYESEMLTINMLELGCALREAGAKEGNTPDDLVVRIAQMVARPPELAKAIPAWMLLARVTSATMLFEQQGNGSGPSRTSRRPTESSIGPQG